MDCLEKNIIRVWKEVEREPRLENAMLTLVRLLAEWFPVKHLLLVCFQEKSGVLDVITKVSPEGSENIVSRIPCQDSDVSPFRQKKVSFFHEKPNIPEVCHELFGSGTMKSFLFHPVGLKNDTLFLLAGLQTTKCTEEMKSLFSESSEVIAGVLERENRYRTLIQQREAIEAERLSLLKKLGRQDVIEEVIGAESGLRQVFERLELIHSSTTPVMLFGESGTGKELIARTIHQQSPRSANPFLRVNCGAVSSELIDRYLFGTEKNGGQKIVPGGLERTDGGTIFLDDIHELPLSAQLQLLKVMEHGRLERIDGIGTVNIDVRVIAATDRDLGQFVSESRFCEPLWYRLTVFPIRIPTLRERLCDMKKLAEHFARRAATRFGLPLVLPNNDDLKRLQGYSWPGNVRELGTVMDRAAILGNGRKLDISAALGTSAPVPPQTDVPVGSRVERWRRFQTIEPLGTLLRRYFEYVLEVTEGKIEGTDGAASLLDVNPNTLRARMKKLGIDWKRYK